MFSDIPYISVRIKHTHPILMRIRQRHLFLMIGVEDEVIKRRITKPESPDQVEACHDQNHCPTAKCFLKRGKKLNGKNQGLLLMMEADEEKLAVAAVSYYIDMMNRNLFVARLEVYFSGE